MVKHVLDCFKIPQSGNHLTNISKEGFKRYQLRSGRRFPAQNKFGSVKMKKSSSTDTMWER